MVHNFTAGGCACISDVRTGGGQGLLYTIGRTEAERNVIANVLGRKWELTFTTLVTFGGAFFASFPLFYSTSFGGAFYVWMLILFVFVLQAVSYEFRRKPGNIFGMKTYNAFLLINGIAGTFLLGVAVGTFFTGAQFTVSTANLTNLGGSVTISQWTTPWRGLDALADYRNISLGLAVLFLARVLGLQFFMNSIDEKIIFERSKKHMLYNVVPFLVFFLLFLVSILFSTGFAVEPDTGLIYMEKFKYAKNLWDMPMVLILMAVGVLSVLAGILNDLIRNNGKGFWVTGFGTVATVLALMIIAGYNNTAYYPSMSDLQSSLTIYNSSSSKFTLTVMSWVSLLLPVVIWYIWYVWRSLGKVKITGKELESDTHQY